MKKGCLKAVLILVGIYMLISLVDAYYHRPTALYRRWIGTSIPNDVTQIDGRFRFGLTESTHWLSFHTTPSRIASICNDLGMKPVKAEDGWKAVNRIHDISYDGRTAHTNWFQSGVFQFPDHLADLEVYWKPFDQASPFQGGYALYYSPSRGFAFYTSITM